MTLAVSILASLLLVGIYLAAGGLDYKPAKAADPASAPDETLSDLKKQMEAMQAQLAALSKK